MLDIMRMVLSSNLESGKHVVCLKSLKQFKVTIEHPLFFNFGARHSYKVLECHTSFMILIN